MNCTVNSADMEGSIRVCHCPTGIDGEVTIILFMYVYETASSGRKEPNSVPILQSLFPIVE